MEQLPIALLDPSLPSQDRRQIKGVVTLIWPFSSSTNSAAVLLAESDVRLRRAKGQVRVQFLASSARAVAESRISIGDEVLLGLGGAKWIKDQGALRTPGKSVDWELCFGLKLYIQIYRGGKELVSLEIDEPTSTPEAERQPPTPPRSGSPRILEISVHGPLAAFDHPNAWASPAYLKRTPAPEPYGLAWPYDPLAEEDGYVEGKGRKRTKFWRESGQWRYVGKSPSPEREEHGERAQESAEFAKLGTEDEFAVRQGIEGPKDLALDTEDARAVRLSRNVSVVGPFGEDGNPQVQVTQTEGADNVAEENGALKITPEELEERPLDELNTVATVTHGQYETPGLPAEVSNFAETTQHEASVKPLSAYDAVSHQNLEVLPREDPPAGSQQTQPGQWSQATQQVRLEAELFGGDTEENTEYDTSQGVELSSAADDGDVTPRQGAAGPFLHHSPLLKQTKSCTLSSTQTETPLRHQRAPSSPTLRPVRSASLPIVPPLVDNGQGSHSPARDDEPQTQPRAGAGPGSPIPLIAAVSTPQERDQPDFHHDDLGDHDQRQLSSDITSLHPDFGIDGAVFSRPEPELPGPPSDEIVEQIAESTTEQLLVSASKPSEDGRTIAVPDAAEKMPAPDSPHSSESEHIAQVPALPTAYQHTSQTLQRKLSFAAPVEVTTTAPRESPSEARPRSSSLSEPGNNALLSSSPPGAPATISSRLQIETYDDDPPLAVASSAVAVDILQSNFSVSSTTRQLDSSASFVAPNSLYVTATLLHPGIPSHQLGTHLVDVSSDDGFDPGVQDLGDEADYSVAEEDEEDKTEGSADDIDTEEYATESEEYDGEERKIEYLEYRQYMDPEESASISGSEEAFTDEEDEELSVMDSDEEMDSVGDNEGIDVADDFRTSSSPALNLSYSGEPVDHDERIDYGLEEVMKADTEQDSPLAVSESVAPPSKSRSGSPGAPIWSPSQAVAYDHDEEDATGEQDQSDYARGKVRPGRRPSEQDRAEDRDLGEDPEALSNTQAEGIDKKDIHEDARSGNGPIRGMPPAEPPQSKASEASGKSLGISLEERKTESDAGHVPLIDPGIAAADAEVEQGLPRSQNVHLNANNATSNVNVHRKPSPPSYVVRTEVDGDLDSEQKQQLLERDEALTNQEAQDAAEMHSQNMNELHHDNIDDSEFVQDAQNAQVEAYESAVAYSDAYETKRSSVSEGYLTLSDTSPGSAADGSQPAAQSPKHTTKPDFHNIPSSARALKSPDLLTHDIEMIDLSQMSEPEPYRSVAHLRETTPRGPAHQSEAIDQGRAVSAEVKDEDRNVTDSAPPAGQPEAPTAGESLDVNAAKPMVDAVNLDRLGRSLSPTSSFFDSAQRSTFTSQEMQLHQASVSFEPSETTTSQEIDFGSTKLHDASVGRPSIAAKTATVEIFKQELPLGDHGDVRGAAESIPTTLKEENSVDLAETALSLQAQIAGEEAQAEAEPEHMQLHSSSFTRAIDLEDTPPSSPPQNAKVHDAIASEHTTTSAPRETSHIAHQEASTAVGLVQMESFASETADPHPHTIPEPGENAHNQERDSMATPQSGAELLVALDDPSSVVTTKQKHEFEGQSQDDRVYGQGVESPPSAPLTSTLLSPVIPRQVISDNEYEQARLISPSSEAIVHRRSSSRRTSARRSLVSDRMSIVADAISPWFSSARRSSKPSGNEAIVTHEGSIDDLNPKQADGPSSIEEFFSTGSKTNFEATHEEHVSSSTSSDSSVASSMGFRTSLSYYTPLSQLSYHLNTIPSPFGNATVDILAVVADSSKPPERAKVGPRDYYTVFHVVDNSLVPMLGYVDVDTGRDDAGRSKGVQVMVFRPWKASLPAAAIGEVVLLRNFVVKSTNGRCSLLSSDNSAWCLWRYPGSVAALRRPTDGQIPAWARRHSQDNVGPDEVVEECKGPPVEIGSEERGMVKQLRAWWKTLHGNEESEDALGRITSVAQDENKEDGKGG